MKKQDGRNLKQDTLKFVRKKSIDLWKQGHNHTQIAKILGVHRVTIGKWVAIYETKGIKGLNLKKRGRRDGSCRTIKPAQEAFIQNTIRDKMPDQLKLPFALWTRRAIQTLIKEQYKIRLPIRSVGNYLERWDFTPQKPLKRAYEQNPKIVQSWVDHKYPAIEKRAKAEKAEIQWSDETGVCNESNYGRSFSPKGVTPVIRRTARRFSTSMVSSISNQGKVRFMCYEGTMNSQTFICFLRRLIKDSPKKIFLIVDNLKVHHSGPVMKWLKKHVDEIELFYLPAYAPERNPDEYLNRDLKQQVSNKPPARNKDQLEKQVFSYMREIQKNVDKVKTYFKNVNVQYAS